MDHYVALIHKLQYSLFVLQTLIFFIHFTNFNILYLFYKLQCSLFILQSPSILIRTHSSFKSPQFHDIRLHFCPSFPKPLFRKLTYQYLIHNKHSHTHSIPQRKTQTDTFFYTQQTRFKIKIAKSLVWYRTWFENYYISERFQQMWICLVHRAVIRLHCSNAQTDKVSTDNEPKCTEEPRAQMYREPKKSIHCGYCMLNQRIHAH